MALIAALALAAAVASAAAKPATPHFPVRLDNGCVAIKALASGDRFLRFDDGTYRASAGRLRGAERFWLKPTDLNFHYLLYDRAGRLMARAGNALTAQTAPGPTAEWQLVKPASAGHFQLSRGNRGLVAADDGALRFRRAPGSDFPPRRRQRLSPLPRGRAGRRRPAVLRHETRRHRVRLRRHPPPHHREPARRRADHQRRALRPLRDHRGARARRGRPRRRRQPRRDRQPAAHRPPVRHPRHPRLADASPAGRSTTPTPISRSTTRGCSAPTTPACGWSSRRRSRTSRSAGSSRVRSHSCDETHTIKLEIQRAAGAAGLRRRPERRPRPAAGSGSSASPRQARRVIERGKLAVVIGVESSDLFGCSEPAGLRPRRRRPRARRAAPARRQQPLRRPLGRQRLRRRRARGRHQGRLHQHLQPGRDRPLLQHRPLPGPEPGRGGEHDRPGRDPDPRPVLPARQRTSRRCRPTRRASSATRRG